MSLQFQFQDPPLYLKNVLSAEYQRLDKKNQDFPSEEFNRKLIGYIAKVNIPVEIVDGTKWNGKEFPFAIQICNSEEYWVGIAKSLEAAIQFCADNKLNIKG